MVSVASSGLVLYPPDRGSSIFRDGLRLVLITFFSFAALWAGIAFAAALTNESAVTSCQIVLVFTTIFDQLARASIEQFLLFAIAREEAGDKSIPQLVTQVLMIGRVIVGAVFVGFTRPEFSPVCAPISSALPAAIVTIVFDAMLIAVLGVRAFSTGLYEQMREKKEGAAKSKAILLIILGLAIWTALSIPMLLGMSGAHLTPRTAVPAAGLTILLVLVTSTAHNVVRPSTTPSRHPEAPSPRNVISSRDIMTVDFDYPPRNYEDAKYGHLRTPASSLNKVRESPGAGEAPPLPNMSRAISVAPRAGGVPIQGNRFLPKDRLDKSPREHDNTNGTEKGAGKLVISNPILQQGGDKEKNPLRKIVTTDLATAALAEKGRRKEALRDIQSETEFAATSPALQAPMIAQEDSMSHRARSFRRNQVHLLAPSGIVPAVESEPMFDKTAAASSAQPSPEPSPGEMNGMRRRSPMQTPEEIQIKTARPETPPRSPLRLLPRFQRPPPRPPRPDLMNVDEVTSPRPQITIITSIPSPKMPRRTVQHPASPHKSVSMLLSSSAKQKELATPRQAPPPGKPSEPAAAVAEDKSLVGRKFTPSRWMTRGAAFPIMPISHNPSPAIETKTNEPEISQAACQLPMIRQSASENFHAPHSAATALLPAPTLPEEDGEAVVRGSTDAALAQRSPTSRKLTGPDIPGPEPGRTLLQRHLTSGLPGNPNAQAVNEIAGEAKQQKEQTVLFINTIQYDDSATAQGIINDASKTTENQASGSSVVHRPRPIPRKPGQDTTFFPAVTPPPGHRRTKSDELTPKRKFIKISSPEILPAIPSLPRPPTTWDNPPNNARKADRTQPKDIRSMNLDEKMTFLFPVPPAIEEDPATMGAVAPFQSFRGWGHATTKLPRLLLTQQHRLESVSSMRCQGEV